MKGVGVLGDSCSEKPSGYLGLKEQRKQECQCYEVDP